ETLTYSDERQEMLLRGRPTLSRRKEKVAAEEILLSMEDDTFTFLGATASIAGEGEEPVTISFSRGEGRLKARDKVNMTGEVKARHGTTSIAAPQAVYDDGAGTIAFAGGVDLRSREAAVTASELLYRRDRKSGTCRGEVHLVRPEEKDENGKAIKDGLILDCSELDFVTDDKTFVARGGVRLHHRDLDAVAEEMRYDDDHQELVLTGSPVLSRKDEEIRAVEVRLAVEKDAFFLREATITSAGKDPVSVSFREGKGNIKEEGRGEVTMEGDVTARQGKTVMRAERAGYEKRSGTMAFRGRVELVREDLTVKAEELDYRRDEQEGTFRRDVFLVRREEKNAAGETTGDGFSLRCAELTFAAEPEHFIARGGARLEHERFMAEAEEMRYRGDDRVLTLAGRPRLIHGDEMVEADTIVIVMREEIIRLTQATVSFKVGSADGAKDAGHKPPAP
ncbi:MAG: LptA/OstA family protein, partial [Bacteroidota bacterium]